MKIKGIEGMTVSDIQDEVNNGGKFVHYNYCFSFLIMSFKRPSGIYFIRSNKNAFVKGLPFTSISLLFGWWGIPWGIVYTISSLFTNLGGGRNVTEEVMKTMYQNTRGYVFEFETPQQLVQSY